MTSAENLEKARADLVMIQPEPFNAEAPPQAVTGDITPTRLHYVRSNFALPDHDGTVQIGGAVDNPTTLTLHDLRAMPAAERVVTLECAGNGRLRQAPLPVGEPWGDYAVSTARWTGTFLHEVLKQARPAHNAIDVRFTGADHGPYYQYKDITFIRSLALSHAADPAAEILIAYAMNGEPLPPDHGAPFRLIVPHWYGVASVKWLKRIDVITEHYAGEFQTGHYVYEWADRPHEYVTVMRVRARITDPAPGASIPVGPTPYAAKPGPAPGRSRRFTSASPAKETGSRYSSPLPGAPTSGRTGRLTGKRTRQDDTHCVPALPTPPGTCSQTSLPGTASATETTQSKSPTSTCSELRAGGAGCRR